MRKDLIQKMPFLNQVIQTNRISATAVCQRPSILPGRSFKTEKRNLRKGGRPKEVSLGTESLKVGRVQQATNGPGGPEIAGHHENRN